MEKFNCAGRRSTGPGKNTWKRCSQRPSLVALWQRLRGRKLTFCTCEDRFVKCKFLEFYPKRYSTRKLVEGGTNTSLGPWHTRVFVLLAGEGRVPGGNVATLELFVFGVGGIPASRKGECGWEASTEYHRRYHRPPLRSF